MSFTTYPYCTVQEVYSALDASSNLQLTDGVWIQELIEEAQTTLDGEISYSFQTDGTVASPATRVYDGNDTPFLKIDDCVSFSSVIQTTFSPTLGAGSVWTLGTPSTQDITADCILTPNNYAALYGFGWKLKRRSSLPFYAGVENYTVLGVFGRPTIPNDIQRACIRLSIHFYQMRNTAYADQIIEQGQVRQTYHKDIPLDVQRVIQRYRPVTFVSR